MVDANGNVPGTTPHAPLPSDAAAVHALLASAGDGVEEYEPGVVTHLLEFVYKYVTDTLLDAETYSEHAGKPGGTVEMDDVMLAIQSRAAYGFVQPPSLDAVMEMAGRVNRRDMPKFPAHKLGVLLPEDKECLTTQGYQYDPSEAAKEAHRVTAQIDRDAISIGEGDHKTFSKEVSGKKVVDLLFHKLLADKELAPYWSSTEPETISHQQDVMMEIAFGAGLLPEDVTYLKEVHQAAMSYRGLTERHFDLYLKHFETVLKELGTIIPQDKCKAAVANMKAAKIIFQK
ncbi:hypothetical protein FOA52_005420 [Chlamydomonas sp. UWO 241]|nr:hypothetical protein FOA52_005420 [Chlamydomonas sp. UWO 241]